MQLIEKALFTTRKRGRTHGTFQYLRVGLDSAANESADLYTQDAYLDLLDLFLATAYP